MFLIHQRLPLNECKQKYAYMDSSFKNDFKSIVASETIREKYKYLKIYLFQYDIGKKFKFEMVFLKI